MFILGYMEQDIKPIPWVEVTRATGQRWSRLEKMLQDYSSSQAYNRGLSVAMLQELLPSVAGSMWQFNQEQVEALYDEIAGYLRTLYRINRVVQVLDMICESTSWERSGKTTDIPFDNDFSMKLVFNPLEGEPKEIDLVEAVHEVFPDFRAKTEDALDRGLQEGATCLLSMFQGEIPLMAYRRDLLPFIDSIGEFPEKFILTNVNEVYLKLKYKEGVDIPQLAFQVRPV